MNIDTSVTGILLNSLEKGDTFHKWVSRVARMTRLDDTPARKRIVENAALNLLDQRVVQCDQRTGFLYRAK